MAFCDVGAKEGKDFPEQVHVDLDDLLPSKSDELKTIIDPWTDIVGTLSHNQYFVLTRGAITFLNLAS